MVNSEELTGTTAFLTL